VTVESGRRAGPPRAAPVSRAPQRAQTSAVSRSSPPRVKMRARRAGQGAAAARAAIAKKCAGKFSIS